MCVKHARGLGIMSGHDELPRFEIFASRSSAIFGSGRNALAQTQCQTNIPDTRRLAVEAALSRQYGNSSEQSYQLTLALGFCFGKKRGKLGPDRGAAEMPAAGDFQWCVPLS